MFKYKDMIVVNEFVFCREHGDEVCYRCTYDHRFTNNYQIMDLPECQGEEFEVFNMYDRESINAYQFGAVATTANETPVECKKHKTVDCKECFNWVEMIRKDALEQYHREKWLEKRKKWLDKIDP